MNPGVILSVGGWSGGQSKDLLAMLNGPKEILRLPARPPPTLRMTPGFIRSEAKDLLAVIDGPKEILRFAQDDTKGALRDFLSLLPAAAGRRCPKGG